MSAISHRPARKVRRTSRTALKRWPSAVAIIGEEAVDEPEQEQVEGESEVERQRRRRKLASRPSRPISRTSVAWISLLREIGEDQRPGERQRRAQLVAPRAVGVALVLPRPSRSSLRGASDEAIRQLRRNGLLRAARNDRWSALARRKLSRLTDEVRPRNLETARRDQGRARPVLHAAVLRHALRRAVGAARAGRGRRARPQPQRQRGRTAGEARNGPMSPAARAAPAISPARPRRRARQGEGRRAGSRRSRSTSTASPAAARPRSATLPRRCAGCARAGKPVVAYGVGYTDDSYQLASAASEIWLNPLGAVLIAGPGRIEPLLQGPARQARRDRQRLSRRHLQVGGRAVHPQRHVARGAAELHGARPGAARNLAQDVSRPGPRPMSTCS